MSVSSIGSAYSSYSAYLSANAGKSTAATATVSAAAADKDTAAEDKTSALTAIDKKLQMGSKLSDRELTYLQDQDSSAYKEAVKINDERSSYRKQLNSAKTKLEAESVRTTKMQALSDELKAVKKDASLTSDEKTSQLESIQKRQMAMVDETQSYTSTSKYNNLSLTTKSGFQSILDSSEDSDISNLLSYFDSSKTDATSFLSILNSAKSTASSSSSSTYSSQLNAAQKLVDASFQAESTRRDSIITQVLARENAKLSGTTSSEATETASKVNLTV